ncbi:hypothetical protein GQR58_029981 [Nymphon striatum]|nr:hypothetical protein GQR58_029981 [Nymphon striatum]
MDRLFTCFFDEGAGVDDDQVRFVGRQCRAHAIGDQGALELVAIDLVLWTTQGLDEVRTRRLVEFGANGERHGRHVDREQQACLPTDDSAAGHQEDGGDEHDGDHDEGCEASKIVVFERSGAEQTKYRSNGQAVENVRAEQVADNQVRLTFACGHDCGDHLRQRRSNSHQGEPHETTGQSQLVGQAYTTFDQQPRATNGADQAQTRSHGAGAKAHTFVLLRWRFDVVVVSVAQQPCKRGRKANQQYCTLPSTEAVLHKQSKEQHRANTQGKLATARERVDRHDRDERSNA